MSGNEMCRAARSSVRVCGSVCQWTTQCVVCVSLRICLQLWNASSDQQVHTRRTASTLATRYKTFTHSHTCLPAHGTTTLPSVVVVLSHPLDAASQ